MIKLVSKLLVLLAVLLMPLGMATAATPVHHEQTAAGVPMEHCPDPAPKQDKSGGLTACTMACSAALPAADFASSDFAPLPYLALVSSLIASLHGIHPETATPPPKVS